MTEISDQFDHHDYEDYEQTEWREPRGPLVLRLVFAVGIAFGAGALFTAMVPNLFDLGLRLGLGALIAVILFLLPINLSYVRSGRMLLAFCIALAFLAGQWGPWAFEQFGGVPTWADIQGAAAKTRYDLLSFGVPMSIDDWVIVVWLATSFGLVFPVLVTSLARPDDYAGYARSNPFAMDREFHQSVLILFLGYPLIAFGLGVAVTYLDEVFGDLGVPTQLSAMLILLVAFLGAGIRARFSTAVIAAVMIGVAGVAGFWGPWLVQLMGVDGALSFVLEQPATLLERIKTLSRDFGYVTETHGFETDYSDWTYPIWVAGTLFFAFVPLIVVIYRRIFFFLRWN